MSALGNNAFPAWFRLLVGLVGVAAVVHEFLTTPRWPVLLTAMAMMGLVTPDEIPDIFKRRKDDQ